MPASEEQPPLVVPLEPRDVRRDFAYTALEAAVLREDHDLTSQEAPITAPALGEADAACCPVNRQVGDLLLGPIKHVVGTADEVEADNYWCVPPALTRLL